MSTTFHVVPSEDVPSLVAIAAMREGTDEEIAPQYGMHASRLVHLRAPAIETLARLDAVIAAALRAAAFDAPAMSMSTGDVRTMGGISFRIGEDAELHMSETTGNGGCIQSLRLSDTTGHTTIALGSVSKSDRVIGRMIVPDVRRRIGRLAICARDSMDLMLGRNGRECTPAVPPSAVDAAEACIRIVGDRLRVPGGAERSGMHAFSTPWSTARTVVDDVAGSAPTAEAAWLPMVAIAHLRVTPEPTGPIRLSFEPLSIRTHFTPADAIQHMRSIAAVSIYRPEDE